MKLFNLTNKVAIITGGNGGIGLAMAKAIGEAGAARGSPLPVPVSRPAPKQE